MPRASLDAPEALPTQALRHVAFGQLEDTVPRMPDEAPARLDEPLLEAHQGPALDGERQDKPAQESAESVGSDPHEHAHLMGAEPRTGKPGLHVAQRDRHVAGAPVAGGRAASSANTATTRRPRP